MNPTDPFKTEPQLDVNTSIDKADRAVQKSLDRFEVALDNLADKIEMTAQKIHRVRDVALDSKDKLNHLTDEVKATISPLKPYLSQAQNLSSKAMVRVKANPKPFIWAGVGIFCGFLAMIYWDRRGGRSRAFGSKRDFSSKYSSEFPYQ
jgi:hypothetical protein